MRITEREYDSFVEDHFPNMNLVRAWTDCRIWSAGIEQHLLVLIDDANRRFALFEYDNLAERERDIKLVHNIPGGEGGANGAIPAIIGPLPPGRSASAALSLPKEDSDL